MFQHMQPDFGTRLGIGGSRVPLSNSPPTRLFQLAAQQNPNMLNTGNKVMGPQITPSWASAAPAMNKRTPLVTDQAMAHAGFGDTGVRPGAPPPMNAVQQARMQGQGGPPPGMGGRDMNDPRNAALAGYR